MGLDWCLKAINEDKSPLEFLGAERCDPSNPKHVEICKEIIQSYRDAISNGHRNDEVFRKHWLQPDEVLIKEMEGNILVPTIDVEKLAKEGVLPATGSPFSVLSGIESYRGKRVQYCTLVSEALQNAAFEEMYPDRMREYADELEECLPAETSFDYAAEKVKADRLNFLESDPTIPQAFWDYDTIVSAVQWLRFWAQHPVKMVPWY
jgi:hypothetical protein